MSPKIAQEANATLQAASQSVEPTSISEIHTNITTTTNTTSIITITTANSSSPPQAPALASSQEPSTDPRAKWSMYDKSKPPPVLPRTAIDHIVEDDYFDPGDHSGKYATDRGDEGLSRYYIEGDEGDGSGTVVKKRDIGYLFLRF